MPTIARVVGWVRSKLVANKSHRRLINQALKNKIETKNQFHWIIGIIVF